MTEDVKKVVMGCARAKCPLCGSKKLKFSDKYDCIIVVCYACGYSGFPQCPPDLDKPSFCPKLSQIGGKKDRFWR